MNIWIKTIPFKRMRYPTYGDYYKQGRILNFRIANLKNKDYEFLILIHEMIEEYLCRKKKITHKMIDDFDMSEYGRSLPDPGSDCRAPYHVEHLFALRVEKMLCKRLDIDWNEYNKFMNE